MSALFSVLLALWSLLYGHVTLYQLGGAVRFVDLYGNQRVADAATGCYGGVPAIWMAPNLSMPDFVHELAHAYDCADDGVMNDSPSLRPATRPGWASDYCWDSDAEWYACSVVYYESVHPYGVAPWGHDAMVAAGMLPGTEPAAAAMVEPRRGVPPAAGAAPAPASPAGGPPLGRR